MADLNSIDRPLSLARRILKYFRPEHVYSTAVVEDTEIHEHNRGHWDSKIDFLLSAIGFSVGLGNIWRFPFKVLANGGGSYIIAYLTMLICMALPIFFIELTLGQFTSHGATECWHFAPGFKGIGYTMLLMSLFCSIYYNTIIAWAFFYLYNTLFRNLPWLRCNNAWNDAYCVESKFDGVLKMNSSKYYEMSTEQFFQRVVITRITANNLTSIPIVHTMTDHLTSFNVPVTLCLALAWLLCNMILVFGIQVSGKSMYFFTTFPYFVIIIMIICGSTLDGSLKGLKFYVTPEFSKLFKFRTWIAAAEQIFFSLGIGFGSLLTFGSYSQFHDNILKDVILLGTINSSTSLLAAVGVFQIIGFMAVRFNKTVVEMDKYAGSGLIFIAYPEGLALFTGQRVLLCLFFLMILCLGVDSQLGMIECAITGILDEHPKLLKHRHIVVSVIHVVCFLIALVFVTKSGYYWFTMISNYSVSTNLLIVGFLETVVISYVYGMKNFSQDVHLMLSRDLCMFWKICIMGPVPLVTLVMSCYSLTTRSRTTVGNDYNKMMLPLWSDIVGNFIFVFTLLPIPVYFGYYFYKKLTVDKLSKKAAFLACVRPDYYYGPGKYRYWKLSPVYLEKYHNLARLGLIKFRTLSHETFYMIESNEINVASKTKIDVANINEETKETNDIPKSITSV